jgi:hypothetical protein
LEWLGELEKRLDWPEDFHPSAHTAEQVRQDVQDYLDQLDTLDLDETDRQVAQHIQQTFRNRWWGLFTCYQVADLPRTNNDLETFMGHLKTRQRRITGRKAAHDFVLRYGPYAAFVDEDESHRQLLTRLQQGPEEAFVKERAALQVVEARLQWQHRFHYHREALLRQLEQRWEEALKASNPGDSSRDL